MEFNFDEIYNQILKEKESCKDPCGICYKELNNKTILLKCNHRFHYECLLKVKKYYVECPYCRSTQTITSLKKKCKALTSTSVCNKTTYYESGYCLKHIDYQEKKCCAKLKSGVNKGKQCTKNVMSSDSDYCKIHKNYKEPKETKSVNLCKFILTRGKNKGNPCCKKVKDDNDFCSRHQINYTLCNKILTKGKNKGKECGKKCYDNSGLCNKHSIKLVEPSVII